VLCKILSPCRYVLQRSRPLLLLRIQFFLLFALKVKFVWRIFLHVARVWAGGFAVPVFLTFLNTGISYGAYKQVLALSDLCTPLLILFFYIQYFSLFALLPKLDAQASREPLDLKISSGGGSGVGPFAKVAGSQQRTR